MTNSGVFLGESQQNNWSAHRKTNNGIGQQNGIFANTADVVNIIDNDVTDGNIIDPDLTPSIQSQAI